MMQRMKGTLRPGRKAGVLALAVLLLTCVLMAGAVSASGEAISQSDFDNPENTYTIEGGGTYVLNGEATGNITIDVDDGGDVTLKAINGATLNGGIRITAAENVTIKDMHINSTLISESDPSDSEARNLAIILPGTSIKLCLENNTIEFAASDVAKKGSSVISTGQPLLGGSEIINNNITGVTAHVLNTAGVADEGTLTVQGNKVTMNPDENIGSNGEKQGTGRALLKLYHPSYHPLNVGVKYIVADNVVTVSSDENYNATVVRVDKNTPNPDKITVTMYNNTYNEDPASPYLYGGSIYGYSLGELSITVSDADGPRILVPGLNQTGVVWSDGAGVVNQELELNESGSYKLMGAFTTTGSGIQITADGVTLDGNDKRITTADTLDGYILKVDVDDTENAKGVTLQNLDITGGVASGTTGNYGGVTVYAGEKKASVPVTLRDSTIDMSGVTATDSMNPAVYFVSASNSWISGNTIKAGSVTTSSTRCVVLDGGEGSTVTGNELHLGLTSSKEGSMGVQIKGSSTKNTVSGNTFIAPNDANTDCRAVEITAVKDKDISSSITGNTINFPGQQKSSAVRVVLSSIGITEENTAVPITLTIENNKGSVKSEVSFWRNDEQSVTEAVKQSYIELKGNKYNPSLTKTEEYFMDAGFATDGTAKPSTNSVTNNNPNDGATTLSVQTDLSSGDKLTKPETPVKDGYTFAGWYKDSACTQGWDFETGISGDMTLYAKWTAAGSSGETEATATPTATAVTTPQPTKTQSTTATTSAPEATTAAGVSPTLTQAPAPVAGALFGLLAAGVLLRRRFQ